MRLNSDTLYLSLMAQAFDTQIVPELRSSGAKAVAEVMRQSFAELLRRRQCAPARLAQVNRDGERLVAEGRKLDRMEPREAAAVAAVPTDFEALSAANDDLTGRLAAVARRLATGDRSTAPEVKRFLRAAAEWEHGMHVALTQPAPPSAAAVPHELLSHDALERFLRVAHADGVRIGQLTRAEGGFGKQTYFLSLLEARSERQLVVRKADRAMAVQHGAFIIEREFELLSTVTASGFAAPRPLWLGERVAGIDGNFFVMERLPGSTPGTLLGGAERIPERFLLDLAELLARLHGMELERFDRYIERFEARSLRWETIEQCYRRSIDEWRRHVADVTRMPSPLMEYLFAWLAEHVPRNDARPVLIHGDCNIHNVLMDEHGRVGGVLDWECAMFGAPEQDLAYIQPHISAHIDWGRFVSHYQATGGRPIDPDSFAFYQAFSAMRVLNGIQWFAKKLQAGESHEIRLCMAELGFVTQFMRFALDHEGVQP